MPWALSFSSSAECFMEHCNTKMNGADGWIRTNPSLFVEDNRLRPVTYATKTCFRRSVLSTTLRPHFKWW